MALYVIALSFMTAAHSQELFVHFDEIAHYFRDFEKTGMRSATVDIYGKKILGVDVHGEYIVSEEEELIQQIKAEYGQTEVKGLIPAEYHTDSIRIVTDYEAPRGVKKQPLSGRGTAEFTELFRKAENKLFTDTYMTVDDIDHIDVTIGIDKETGRISSAVGLFVRTGKDVHSIGKKFIAMKQE